MKIAHVLFALCTGGAEHMLIDIMAEQVKAGHEVSLIVINDLYEQPLYDRIKGDGVNIVMVGRPVGTKNPLWYWRYNRALRRLQPDIVHFHQRNSPIVTIPLRHAKSFVTIHDTHIDFPRWLRIHHWCAISEAVRTDFEGRQHRPAITVTNGIRTDKITCAPSPGTISDGLHMIMVSRLDHNKKGHDLLLRAMRTAIDSGRMPCPISIDFVGEGPSLQYLQTLTTELGLDDCVTFRGNQPRQWVYTHLADYQLLVQPSRFEGFGLTIAEGMAAKVPVLVSDCEGPMEIVDGDRYGDVFHNGDADDLANKLIEIANNYPSRSTRAHGEAYRYAVENFDVRATAHRYLELYEKA